MATATEGREGSDARRKGRSGELVIGVVAPVGTETNKVERSIRAILESYDYCNCELKVSWFFEDEKVAEFLSQPIQKEPNMSV